MPFLHGASVVRRLSLYADMRPLPRGAFLVAMRRAALGADRVRLMGALFAVARSGLRRPLHTSFGENCLERILVSGVSGPIGTALLSSFEPELEPRGMQIVRLVRRRTKSGAADTWNPLAPLLPAESAGGAGV